MNIYTVVVYNGFFKEEIEVRATNQAHLKTRVKGLGYDRLGHISNVRPE
jgi:hypothetical protein